MGTSYNAEHHKNFSASMRKALKELPQAIKMSPHILIEIINTLKHAQVFISTRQKMHPDGIKLHEGLIIDLEDMGKEEKEF